MVQALQYHYRPQKGWVNDPNGLVWFRGYYHVFYQHAPDFEQPWKQPMHWGHARTKDFLTWEELPVALYPDRDYDKKGCWSGTAAVKDDTLYLFYASIDQQQTVSVACSTDGICFQKYEDNPVIGAYPADGRPDFRDPAVQRTETGFAIERQGRAPVVCEGDCHDLQILRDGDYVEVFLNRGEAVYTALL